MKKVILFALLLGCTNESASVHTLKDAGYEEIQMTGYAPFECGQDDFSSTAFRATNIRGRKVEGVVCCGFFAKGCTIRH